MGVDFKTFDDDDDCLPNHQHHSQYLPHLAGLHVGTHMNAVQPT